MLLQNINIALDGTTKGQSRSLLALRFGGVLNGEDWMATIGVLNLAGGKSAKEQAEIINNVWRDLKQQQQRMGVPQKELHQIQSISFDNAADNCGVKNGIRAELDQQRKESARVVG